MEQSKQIIKKNSELYDKYLCGFQKDIKRIVGKFKKSFHALTDEEVYSECNIHLLKNKEKILSTFGENEITENEFKKIAYHYVKNETVWTHYRHQNQAYNRRKLDGVANTDDGVKTSFEIAIDQQGEENKDLDNDIVFFGKNAKTFIHILTEYSYLLTETEVKIISFIEKGWNQDRMAKELGVTHQAVSFAFIQLKDKLNAYFDFNSILHSDTTTNVSKGIRAMDDFFESDIYRLSKNDRKAINSLLLKHPKLYNVDQINQTLFDGKFKPQQIGWHISRAKLRHLLGSKYNNYNFPPEEKSEILDLFKKGFSTQEIAKLKDKTTRKIGCLRSSFVKSGLLEKIRELTPISESDRDKARKVFLESDNYKVACEKLKSTFTPDQVKSLKGAFVRNGLLEKKINKFSQEQINKILDLYKNGETAVNIAKKIGVNVKSITPVIGSFHKKGLCSDMHKQRGNIFNREITEKMTKLFLEGNSSKEVANKLNLNVKSVSGFRSSLTIKGLLKKSPKKILKFSEKESKKILKLREQGMTSQEIANILNTTAKSIGSFLGMIKRS